MKTISRYIMTLALLMTAASGAWAEEVTVTFTPDDLNGTSTVTKDGVTLTPGNGDARSGANFYHRGSNTFSVDKGTFTKIEIVDCNYVYPDNINGWQKEETGSYRPYPDDDAWPLYTLTWTGEAESVTFTAAVYEIQSIVFTINKPEVDVTTNKAQGETTFTEATFAMPTFDATVDYELVRDLSVETALNIFVIENEKPVALTEDSRLRIAKNGDNGYLPVNTLTCAFIDGIENVTMTPQQIIAAGMTPVFYLLGENDTWTPVPAANINPQTMLPTNIAPGQTYRMTLVANEGSIYDGETAPTFTITLFEGYPVEIAAGEYATFYKDENLYVEDEDAKLYTISSVEGDKAYLSSAFDAAPANTPLLVFNSSEKPKTILLIPTEQEPNLALTVAPEFTGTLEGTTLQALLGCDSYVFNGKAFVWVKDEIAVPANKCWLAITTGTPNNAKTITIVFDEDATGVRSVDNGQVRMDNDVWYDLNGRKLNKKPTTKGIYIKNGKKVVIR